MGGSNHGDGMGGSEYGDDWELAEPTTVVLVGRTGNGKSATGNSILGDRIFNSKYSSSAVTSTCELKEIRTADGRSMRVVDTPGLFDPAMPAEFVMNEIMKCLELAKDGVHALLLVLSVRNRFTAEEAAAVESLQTIFGEKMVNYMIVIFTGGDELEDNEQTLDDYLSADAPEILNAYITKCGNRKVPFDNKTKDKVKKEQQFSELMNIIDDMVAANGGKPCSSELFEEARQLALRDKNNELLQPGVGDYYNKDFQSMKEELTRVYTEQLEHFKVLVEEKLRLSAEKLEEKLRTEQQARAEIERRARADQVKAEEDIRLLRDALECSNRDRDSFMEKMRSSQASQASQSHSSCTII